MKQLWITSGSHDLSGNASQLYLVLFQLTHVKTYRELPGMEAIHYYLNNMTVAAAEHPAYPKQRLTLRLIWCHLPYSRLTIVQWAPRVMKGAAMRPRRNKHIF